MTPTSTSGSWTSAQVLRALNVGLLAALLAGTAYAAWDVARTAATIPGTSFEQATSTAAGLVFAFLAALVVLVLRIPDGRPSKGWASIALWVPGGLYLVPVTLSLFMSVAVAFALGGALTVLALGASIGVIRGCRTRLTGPPAQ